LKSWYIRFIEVPVLKRADVLFALSQRESDVYRLWSSNERIQSLPNGVDAAFWSAGLLDRQSSKELSAPGRVRRVIWSARWDLRKGPLEFIEMAKCVSKLLPKVQFVMLGPARGASLAVVEAAAAASGLENLTLMKGLDAASRREQLQAADFFVLPTDGEGFSLGILEALAAGCVVLTTDEANFPELRDQCFGHIIKKDPQLFANVLVELLGSAEAMNASIRSKASAFVRKNYDWSSITDRYIKIMASTLDE
jgi:glycosyltransferase involved in cell wall biosynthesis